MSKPDNFPNILSELVAVAGAVVDDGPGVEKALSERAIRALTKSRRHVHEPALRERLLAAIAELKAARS